MDERMNEWKKKYYHFSFVIIWGKLYFSHTNTFYMKFFFVAAINNLSDNNKELVFVCVCKMKSGKKILAAPAGKPNKQTNKHNIH